MKYRSYHREIEKATAQILDVFSGIVIDRRDQANNVQQNFTVQCVYASKTRLLKSLQDRGKTMQLPIMAISIAGVARDAARVHSIHDGLVKQSGGGGSSYDYLKNTPVPITIKYNLNILAKRQLDMDQIISNWLVFMNPDIYVVIPHPVRKGQMLKCQIVWDGALSMTYPEEIGKDIGETVAAQTSFDFRTWMFPGMDYDDDNNHRIKRINFTPNICYGDDGVGALNAFYPCPYSMDMSDYTKNIVCGLIKTPNFDWLPISGGVSGYFYNQISGALTGLTLGVNLSGDNLCFLTTENPNELLVVSERCYLPEGTAAIGLDGYISYYNSMITGELSGCPEMSGLTPIPMPSLSGT